MCEGSGRFKVLDGREELGKVLLGRGWTLKEAMTSGRTSPGTTREKPGCKVDSTDIRDGKEEDHGITLSIIAC